VQGFAQKRSQNSFLFGIADNPLKSPDSRKENPLILLPLALVSFPPALESFPLALE
jgi:hypothetical protein